MSRFWHRVIRLFWLAFTGDSDGQARDQRVPTTVEPSEEEDANSLVSARSAASCLFISVARCLRQPTSRLRKYDGKQAKKYKATEEYRNTNTGRPQNYLGTGNTFWFGVRRQTLPQSFRSLGFPYPLEPQFSMLTAKTIYVVSTSDYVY